MRNTFVCFLLIVLSFNSSFAQERLTSFVDPFIGTGGQGHTFPGAVVPFGMVQLSPDNGRDGKDWVSGYHYSDNKIAGFSHMHLSESNVGDWIDISVMPLITPLKGQDTVYRSETFSHQNEQAYPGYYAVKLNNGIQVELTTTERVGYHRYIFPAGSQPTIRFDLAFHQNQDIPTETFLKKVNDSTLVGYRYSTGWINKQRVYFAARTSRPVKEFHLKGELNIELGDINIGLESKEQGKGVLSQLIFDHTDSPETIEMKVALSMTSIDKAILALEELPGWNFNAVRTQADVKWENELKKIQITTSDLKLKRIFYTALYHSAISPAIYSDADGEYSNADGQKQKVLNGGVRYNLYSLGESRAVNPLLMLTQPERYTDIFNSNQDFNILKAEPSKNYYSRGLANFYSVFHDKPDTYAGNQGPEQMSIWAIWNVVGIYPTNSTGEEYKIESPLVDAVKFQLKNNKKLEIEVLNNNPQNKYIQSVKINGLAYKRDYILYKDLIRGGKIIINMGSSTSNWISSESQPTSSQSSAKDKAETVAEPDSKDTLSFPNNIIKSVSEFFNNLFK